MHVINDEPLEEVDCLIHDYFKYQGSHKYQLMEDVKEMCIVHRINELYEHEEC